MFLLLIYICFSGVGVTLASLPSTQQPDDPDLRGGARVTHDVEALLQPDEDRAQDDTFGHETSGVSAQSISSPLQGSSPDSPASSMSISFGDERDNVAEEEDNIGELDSSPLSAQHLFLSIEPFEFSYSFSDSDDFDAKAINWYKKLLNLLTKIKSLPLDAQVQSLLSLSVEVPESSCLSKDSCSIEVTSFLKIWKDTLAARICQVQSLFSLPSSHVFVDILESKCFEDSSAAFGGNPSSLSLKLRMLVQIVQWAHFAKLQKDSLYAEPRRSDSAETVPLPSFAFIPYLSLDQITIDLGDNGHPAHVKSSLAAEVTNNFPRLAPTEPITTPSSRLKPEKYFKLKQVLALQLLSHFVPFRSLLLRDMEYLQFHMSHATDHINYLLCLASHMHPFILLEDLTRLCIDLVLIVKLRIMARYKLDLSPEESTKDFITRVFLRSNSILDTDIQQETLVKIWEKPFPVASESLANVYMLGGGSCFRDIVKPFCNSLGDKDPVFRWYQFGKDLLHSIFSLHHCIRPKSQPFQLLTPD